MKEKELKLVSPLAIIIDILLTLGFGVFMTGVVRPHVPTTEEPYLTFFSIFTAVCMSGGFWLALQCFRVTLVDQLKNKR